MEVEIEKVSNGYIITKPWLHGIYRTTVHLSLEDVMRELLSIFESRSALYTGNLYGVVKIIRGREDET